MNIRTVFGVLAWMFSSSLDASEVTNLIGVSADENPTSFLLSKVRALNAATNESDSTNSKVNKSDEEDCSYRKIIFASGSTTICGTEIQNIYIYPNPIYHTIYVSGVDEEDTHLIIYDVDGNCISGEFGNEIEVAFLQKGTYILGINDYFVKFIKQ
jgi:hypothetical protein